MHAAEPAAAPLPAPRPDAGHFAAARCHNCGADRHTPYCGQCGQAKAKRFGLRAVGGEAWQNWRLFEFDLLKAAARVVLQPGHVAREYVLGARMKHVHPLKLLLTAIGVLLLVLARSNYLESSAADYNRTMELVRAWSNWSFSLGIVAILAASWAVFGRRGGYNAVEHLVLAAYCQFLLICASVVGKLPALVWRAPEFLAAHKAASAWYMHAVGALVVAVGLVQFFHLDVRRDAWRLALAIAVFIAVKLLLMRAYGLLLVSIVLAPGS